MRFRSSISLALCLASLSGIFAVYAQNGAPNPKKVARKVPLAPRADQLGAVIVNGDESVSYGATDTSKLTGNVSVSQVGEDFILYAQSLVFSKPQNRAIATGKLVVKTRESTITGNRIDANFTTKILTLTGDVVIRTHGKGDGITGNRATGARAEFASKPSKLFCDRVDWDYETREAVLTGNIRMEQGKNRGTCGRIEFDERQNVARLMGRVAFTDERGQTYSTPDLTIYNNENRIVTGRSSLKILPNTGQAPGAAPRAPKAPVAVKKAPVIADEELAAFGVKPPPVPAFRPEPAPIPAPDPAAEEAPETPATPENDTAPVPPAG